MQKGTLMASDLRIGCVLMASGMAGISPASIIPYLYYPYLLGAFALLSILFNLKRAK